MNIAQHLEWLKTKPIEFQNFAKFHQDNPHVYKLFWEFTNLAWKKGVKVSASLVIDRIRWEVQIQTKSDVEFTIANEWKAYYSRYMMAVCGHALNAGDRLNEWQGTYFVIKTQKDSPLNSLTPRDFKRLRWPIEPHRWDNNL
jgi:hypothetical protein